MISHDKYLGESIKRASYMIHFGAELHSPRLFKPLGVHAVCRNAEWVRGQRKVGNPCSNM